MRAPLLYEQDGPVVTLTINRPEERNATEAGTAFSAGGDVNQMRHREGMFAGSACLRAGVHRRHDRRTAGARRRAGVPRASRRGAARGGARARRADRRQPAAGLAVDKRLIREGLLVSLPTLLELSAAFQAMAHHTGDHREAIAAFFERRAPRFRGS